jgi:thioredoxin-related protein
MIKNLSSKGLILIIILLSGLLSAKQLYSQLRDVSITIHLRGVYESEISVLGLSPAHTFVSILNAKGIKNGQTTTLVVPKDKLPGEFVLRFDYKETSSSAPYPSEKYIFASNQDLELWVSPVFCNNPDSSYFQADEKENAAFARFSVQNGKEKEKLGLLQNFLMSYDDTGSKFYQEGIKEYEKRRVAYNTWLYAQAENDKALFVSSLYGFQFVAQIPWTGSETDRIYSLIDHYFDGIDIEDSLIIKTSDINKWMDNYVNLYGQLCTTTALRDSLFPLAGKRAIETVREGSPLLYGWMVDYFYRGYEANGIDAGIKILGPYLDDPNCLTSKRQEIARRLKGMETLVKGAKAPDISMSDSQGNLFELSEFGTPSQYILLFFWSADCSHCKELAEKLYPWQQQADIAQKVTVIAISLDETDTEIKAWDQKITELQGWRHIRAEEGVRSKVASDYYVLATPIMVLLDSKTHEIVAMPNTLEELKLAVGSGQ